MTKITSVRNFSKVFANLRRGDCLFFDIDQTLLLCGLDKYHDAPQLTEKELATQIKIVQEMGIEVYGLTARDAKREEKTVEQLKDVGIFFSNIIYAPSLITSDDEKEPQKAHALKNHLASLTAKPNRIVVVDDLKDQLDAIEMAFGSDDPTLILYHYERLQYQPITKQDKFPESLKDFRLVDALGGGTESTFKIYNPQTNQTLVLKYGAHPDALKAEALCNAVYRTLGVSVPKSQIYNTLPNKLAKELKLSRAYGLFQVSEYISPPDTPLNKEKIIKEARKNFIIHALLGNIDVAKLDNFIGETLIDAGANFLFRAKGEKRSEETSIVSELDSMVNHTINPEAARWFSNLTKAEIKEQILAILEKQDAVEATLWDVSAELEFNPEIRSEFLQYFADRLEYLVTHFCPEARQGASLDRKARAEHTAAGVLTWTVIDSIPHLLFAKRARHDWWDNFGGKSEAEDTWLYETASREVAEESNNQLNYTNDELLRSPFHDLITEKEGKPFVYRMYFAEHDYVAPSQFRDKEHTAYQWVSVPLLIEALNKDKEKIVEFQKTIAIQKDAQEIILFPPICSMFKQTAVLKNILALAKSKKLFLTHTQSTPTATPEKGARYRVLRTPEIVRQQIHETLIKRADVLAQLKAKNKLSDKTTTLSELSQSELHLRVILGDKYQVNNLRGNVEYALTNAVPSKVMLTTDEKKELVDKLTQLIEIEKTHPERVYFYHACDDQVAFLYQVYTTLHQMLQANQDWFAFRGTDQFFTQFETITQLIAHYSSKESGEISNNSADFHERAISTNVFLFGNSNHSTSNSICYLLENSTRRNIDLSALLNTVFRAVGVSQRDINSLVQLYNQHIKDKGGSLYQMSMPRETVAEMTYAAGSMGILNPYNKSIDLNQIMATLQDRRSHLTNTDKKYIKELQARVLVSPRQVLQTREVRLHDLGELESNRLMRNMRHILGGGVRSILASRNEFNADYLHQSTPMLRLQTWLYQANNLLSQAEITPTLLAKAIIDNNRLLVEFILKKYPQFKNEKISYEVYRNFKQKELHLRPLEMIFCESTLPRELLNNCFGGEWLQQLRFECESQLMDILSKLTTIERSQYFNTIYSVILQQGSKSTYKLINILSMLSFLEGAYFIHLCGTDWVVECMKKERDLSKALDILVRIPKDQHLKYIQALGMDWIKENIGKADDFVRIVCLLEDSEATKFIELFGINRIKAIPHDLDSLKVLFERLPYEKHVSYCDALELPAIIKKFIRLNDIPRFMRKFPNKSILTKVFGINMLTYYSGGELFASFGKEWFSDWIVTCIKEKKNWIRVFRALNAIDQVQYFKDIELLVMNCIKTQIKTPKDFVEFLKLLHPEDKNEFIELFGINRIKEIPQNVESLGVLFCDMPDDRRWSYCQDLRFQWIFKQLKTQDEIRSFLSYFSCDKQSNLAKEFGTHFLTLYSVSDLYKSNFLERDGAFEFLLEEAKSHPDASQKFIEIIKTEELNPKEVATVVTKTSLGAFGINEAHALMMLYENTPKESHALIRKKLHGLASIQKQPEAWLALALIAQIENNHSQRDRFLNKISRGESKIAKPTFTFFKESSESGQEEGAICDALMKGNELENDIHGLNAFIRAYADKIKEMYSQKGPDSDPCFIC